MSLALNQQLFEYRIERVLGQGAFGTVYLAQDTLLERLVAIKELTVAAQSDEVAFKRFLQEARAAGNLNHPHIVTVYALKVVDPAVYLVMEYLAGGSLRTWLERDGRLPVEEAVRIAADVCEGLAAAHAKGIIHRDVKLENILLTADSRAKVGDFGIAHVPHGAGGTYLSALTQAGFQPGTLLYMSPEQIRGQQVDGRSDVYQVGALLYELLTGRHYVDWAGLERRARETAGSNVMLFQARLYEMLSQAICEQEPAGVCGMRADVPVWVGNAVAAALAKKVEERPTAAALARALRNGETVWVASVRPTTPLSEFLDHVGGIPEDNRDPRFREVNEELRMLLSHITIEQICYELKREVAKRANGRAYKLLGFAYFNAGRIDDAIRLLKKSLTCTIEDPVAIYETLGKCYVLKEDWTNAERWFARSDRYDFPYLLRTFGRDFIYVSALGDQQQGVPVFGSFNDSEFVRQYWQLIALSMKVRLAQAAPEQVREAAFELRQSFHSDTLNEIKDSTPLAIILPYPGGPKSEADSTSSRLAEEHFKHGVVYEKQGRLEEAIREYRAALRINPNHSEAHYNLGWIYRQLGRLEEAIREYQAALRINPNYAEVHYNLGVIYGKQGRLEEAIREFQAALRINPNFAEAHLSLGVAYGQQGRRDEAVREAETALQSGFEPARELLAELSQMRYTREDSTGVSRDGGVRAPAQYTASVCPNCGSTLTRYSGPDQEGEWVEVFVCDTCGWSGENP